MNRNRTGYPPNGEAKSKTDPSLFLEFVADLEIPLVLLVGKESYDEIYSLFGVFVFAYTGT